MSSSKIFVAAAVFMAVTVNPATAAPPNDGDLAEWGFLNSGKTIVPFDVPGDSLLDMAADSFVDVDGSMYIAGTVSTPEGYRIGVVKLLPDGGLADGSGGTPAFSSDGKNMTLDTGITASAIARNGQHILVAGTKTVSDTDRDFVVCRFHVTNGNNIAFPNNNNSSCVTPPFLPGTPDYAADLIVQPDGKFVVVGTVDSGPSGMAAFARFNADGSPDMDFGNILGSNMSLVRNDIVFASHVLHAATLTSNGKIVGVGETLLVDNEPRALVIRLDEAGIPEHLEYSFSRSLIPGGKTVLMDVTAVDVGGSNDDALIVVGYADATADRTGGLIGKLNPDAVSLADGEFGNNNGVTMVSIAAGDLVFESVAAQPGGSFVTLGQRPGEGNDPLDLDIRRFGYRGDLDTTLEAVFDAATAGDLDLPAAISVQGDGVYISGSGLATGNNLDFTAAKFVLDRIFENGIE